MVPVPSSSSCWMAVCSCCPASGLPRSRHRAAVEEVQTDQEEVGVRVGMYDCSMASSIHNTIMHVSSRRLRLDCYVHCHQLAMAQ
jgi:hypothetical protein